MNAGTLTPRQPKQTIGPERLVAPMALIASVAVFWYRGICWESLAVALVLVATAVALMKVPFTVWLATVAIVSVLATLGLMGWSELRFHSVDLFSSNYPRISFCGRDFGRAGSLRKDLPSLTRGVERVVGVTPSGSALINSGACLSTLWVRSPGPRYQEFDLLGGP